MEPTWFKNLASTGKVLAMTSPPSPSSLGAKERLLLVLLAAVLASAVLWLRGGLHPEAPLERLARQSPDLQVALTNGKPTMVEFYADWCEACRAMAPAMETLEQQHRGQLNVVLLNVDNPRWQPEMDRYAVNGIPQLEFFSNQGKTIGRSIGARTATELQALGLALIEDSPLPAIAGVGKVSQLNEDQDESSLRAAPTPVLAGPRSHG
jgi:thiol:disulfide interchange protein